MSGRAELIAQWLEYAAGDLKTAISLRQQEGIPLRNICYMAQQSAEKTMKCLFVYLGIEVMKSHDLVYLYKKLPDKALTEIELKDLAWLSYWAVEARYPGDWPDVDFADADRATEFAEKLYRNVEKVIEDDQDFRLLMEAKAKATKFNSLQEVKKQSPG